MNLWYVWLGICLIFLTGLTYWESSEYDSRGTAALKAGGTFVALIFLTVVGAVFWDSIF